MLGTLPSTGTTLTIFSGRVYVRAGSVPDTFNLGILNGAGGTAAPTFSPTDYNINTTYFIVVKFDIATNTASLWINPSIGGIEGTATVTNATGTSGLKPLHQMMFCYSVTQLSRLMAIVFITIANTLLRLKVIPASLFTAL